MDENKRKHSSSAHSSDRLWVIRVCLRENLAEETGAPSGKDARADPTRLDGFILEKRELVFAVK